MSPVHHDVGRAPELLEVRDAYRIPELIIERARELAGCAVALYVVDLDGSFLLHLAGEGVQLEKRVAAPLAVGPELAPEAIGAVQELIGHLAPETTVVPLIVRDRALGVLVCEREPTSSLDAFAADAAMSLELAAGYSDVVHSARRHKETKPAAEIQQGLLPPRLATLPGYTLAGGVLPGYEIGGDFFDYAANADGLWVAIGDAVGKGTAAAALAAIGLGAYRAARRSGSTLLETLATMDEAIASVGDFAYLTAILAICDADRNIQWITCGHPPPLRVGTDGTVVELTDGHTWPLGLWPSERKATVAQTRLARGEQLVLYSDGVTDRKLHNGGRLTLAGIEDALKARPRPSAAATVRALHSAVIEAATAPLDDDATVLAIASA
ncbi:MAG: serine/threonine-protein phosphatase [Solirubrobacterales bacterium]|nr:serine/threonine-protein phosphatase [Solirubrobacterales bacterium]